MEINPSQLTQVRPLRPVEQTHEQQVAKARELQNVYQEFVGKTFFGQLLKSMRSTVGKPAYFHGGQAEEVFRSQLDQTLAEHMTVASAAELADPMFKQQFPQQAAMLEAEAKREAASMSDLALLRRR